MASPKCRIGLQSSCAANARFRTSPRYSQQTRSEKGFLGLRSNRPTNRGHPVLVGAVPRLSIPEYVQPRRLPSIRGTCVPRRVGTRPQKRSAHQPGPKSSRSSTFHGSMCLPCSGGDFCSDLARNSPETAWWPDFRIGTGKVYYSAVNLQSSPRKLPELKNAG